MCSRRAGGRLWQVHALPTPAPPLCPRASLCTHRGEGWVGTELSLQPWPLVWGPPALAVESWEQQIPSWAWPGPWPPCMASVSPPVLGLLPELAVPRLAQPANDSMLW